MFKAFHSLFKKAEEAVDSPYIFWLFGFLGLLSASIIPLPLDPLFVLLAIQRPQKIALFSVAGVLGIALGGVLMYAMGYIFYHTLGQDLIASYGLEQEFVFLQQQLEEWGGWILIIKAFTPFPYKLIALICGIVNLNLFVFIAASLVGRGLRFALEGVILKFYGQQILLIIKKHWFISTIVLTILVVLSFAILKVT